MSGIVKFEHFGDGDLDQREAGPLLPDFLRPSPSVAEPVVVEPPKVDPEKVALEAALAERHEAADRVNDLLTDIEKSWKTDVEAMVNALSCQTLDAVGALLPDLLNEFGANQLATGVVALVDSANVPDPVLLLSPDDFDEVLSALSDQDSRARIEVRKATNLTKGTASLQWEQGGAEFDIDSLLNLAREALRPDATEPTHGAQKT